MKNNVGKAKMLSWYINAVRKLLLLAFVLIDFHPEIGDVPSWQTRAAPGLSQKIITVKTSEFF